MAGGREYTKNQRGIINRYYQHQDTIRSERLADLVSELYLAMDEPKAKRLWENARKALLGAGVEPARVDQILTKRDIKAFAAVAADVDAGKIKPAQMASTSPPPPAGAPPRPTPLPKTTPHAGAGPDKLDYAASNPDGTPTQEVCKAALKAFRKRLKLTKLDSESKLGRSPLSSGKKSDVVAIKPPAQYPVSVWEHLTKEGKLRNTGGGFYELLE